MNRLPLAQAQARARAITAERAAASANLAQRAEELREAQEQLRRHVEALGRVVGGRENIPPYSSVYEEQGVKIAEVNLKAAREVVELYMRRDEEAKRELREAEGRVDEKKAAGPRFQEQQQQAARDHEREAAGQRAEELRQEHFQTRKEWLDQQATPQTNLTVATCTAWKARADAVLVNPAELKIFPTPPVFGICKKHSCIASRSTRALEACPCDIKSLFQILKGSVSLKEERVKWHPDRFSGCREDKRQKFQAMAQEIFLVVDGMYAVEKEGGKS